MIPPKKRFHGDRLNIGKPDMFWVIDFDQRRWITVTGSKEALPDMRDAASKVLSRHVNQLGPDVYGIKVSDDGDLLSVSSDPEDDITPAFEYPRYEPSPELSAANEVFSTRLQLTEVDRLGAGVDLVRYEGGSGDGQLVTFKYTMREPHLTWLWNELQIMKILSGHELIVPFHSIILDDIEPRVLGYTLPYIPGGTFADNQTRTFRFSWLQQLTSVVDDLNLKFGIARQDIHKCNLLVDPTTGKIQLFDFQYAAKIGSEEHISRGWDQHAPSSDVDDVIFTIYEILTLDMQFFDRTRYVREVEEMVDWDVKVPIEEGHGGVTGIRQFLKEWAQARRAKPLKHSEASTPLTWPKFPEEYFTTSYRGVPKYRSAARKNGQHVVSWERPATKAILEDGEMKLTSKREGSPGERSEGKRAKSSERS